ncbi:hypothetical protein [Sodalis-like endosymbiont of Proechinophthirus fluctus]|uniref:hypothetical protein n=1 Tax=Sodalis-like endosymbiont of Proechinophthirus fluctus TaxID=1462730 RepID=UPI000A646A73|nr:hypothetical protein [Sodalis-like endosymbiont of Proechinophthirus fluctus]
MYASISIGSVLGGWAMLAFITLGLIRQLHASQTTMLGLVVLVILLRRIKAGRPTCFPGVL